MDNMGAKEWQFDGLVGPTHNYSGLSFGNIASELNKNSSSNPRAAALQGIQKMRLVMRKTGAQSFFIPQYRPIVSELYRLGFEGDLSLLLKKASSDAPDLLASVYSASSMWAANAATVAPSVDTRDGKVHFTPANLITKFHRSIEPNFTARYLRRVFSDARYFRVHDPLPASARFSDEGAANHLRLAPSHGERGLHVFVYGMGEGAASLPTKFPARQHEEACKALARLHQLDEGDCIFVQQSPEAIDAGIFHHDVAGMSALMFAAQHEKAWVGQAAVREAVAKRLYSNALRWVDVREAELPLREAVASYFFNSQLLADAHGRITILAPVECAENAYAKALFDRWLAEEGPVAEVQYLDVRESMRNGGGPACLRLRVVLTEEEARAMHQGVVLTEALADRLEAWVKEHYRDRLCFDDLRDPLFIREIEEALDALSQIVGLPGIYPFQHG